MIGLSEGNGHPYSWSAIFNGYDPSEMASCPFPVIPEYLSKQTFPDDSIPGAQVTHIWTQDKAISRHVAKAALIPNIVDDFEAMVGCVDGVLLARDDAENHLSMSKPFLKAGMPVYIDKPIALSVRDLEEIYRHEQFPGQIFSCSAFRFSSSLRLASEAFSRLGSIKHFDAIVPKKWETYGVHLLDPVLHLFGLSGLKCDVRPLRVRGVHIVIVDWGELSACFSCLGDASTPVRIRVFGTENSTELVFNDTFASFKAALQSFLEGIVTRREMTPRSDLTGMVSILERGRVGG